MPTLTAEPVVEPDLEPVDDDKPDHLYCCDPDVSLCGLDISGDLDMGELPDDCEHPVCPLCERIIDEPCGAPKCPDRRRWWQRRRSR